MKQATVQSGPYAGKTAAILGTDDEVLGQSIYGMRTALAFDYFKRMGQAAFSALDKVFIANIDGQNVALNQKELKKQKGV